MPSQNDPAKTKSPIPRTSAILCVGLATISFPKTRRLYQTHKMTIAQAVQNFSLLRASSKVQLNRWPHSNTPQTFPFTNRQNSKNTSSATLILRVTAFTHMLLQTQQSSLHKLHLPLVLHIPSSISNPHNQHTPNATFGVMHSPTNRLMQQKHERQTIHYLPRNRQK